MSYSDEPNVITERTRSRKPFVLVGGLLLFIGLLASVALFPRIVEFKRRHTPFGPHGGSFYEISFQGGDYSMELARSEAYDFRTAIYIEPLDEQSDWEPAEYSVRLRLDGQEEFEVLAWDSVEEYFGLSEHRIHPRSDMLMELELKRGEEVVWSGRRWSFREAGGHGH